MNREQRKKIAVKYFRRAIFIDFLTIFLTFLVMICLFNRDFIENLLNTIENFGIPSLVAVCFTLSVGNWLGESIDYPKLEGGICVILGVILLFFLLAFGASVGIFTFRLLTFRLLQIKEINLMQDFIYGILYFYLFGGIQTLIIGIVLGYKLSCIGDITKK